MKRNIELEKEMQAIASLIWSHIGIGREPKIESKYGGSTGAYYPSEHCVRIRWTSWAKMPEAGKRMIMIHELYHAAGHHHNSKDMFCHAFDILTIQLYLKIYGEDEEFVTVMKQLDERADELINYSQSLKRN